MRLTLSHAVLAALGVVATAATSSFASDTPEGNVGRGAAAFQQVCSACHTIERDARRRVGPNLFGVLGSRIAQKAGYPYTEAFRSPTSCGTRRRSRIFWPRRAASCLEPRWIGP